MSRLARLEQRIADLEDALASVKFQSDAPTVAVQVPVPVLDSGGTPTGETTTGFLQIKTGPSTGELKVSKGVATLTLR